MTLPAGYHVTPATTVEGDPFFWKAPEGEEESSDDERSFDLQGRPGRARAGSGVAGAGRRARRRECFIGVSTNVSGLKEFIGVQAAHRQPALLIGERGLRQEQIARVLHQASESWAQPFFAVNAHGLSGDALHTLLFGPRGMIETCLRGTIYINELTSLPAPAPAALRRLPRGAAVARATGSATPAADLRHRVEPGGARAENRLAYGLVETAPPLELQLRRCASGARTSPTSPPTSPSASPGGSARGRTSHARGDEGCSSTPGRSNIDELEAVLESASPAPRGPHLTSRAPGAHALRDAPVDPAERHRPPRAVDDYERTFIDRALRQTGGNQTRPRACSASASRPST